jgi:hypothetical protein
METLLSSRSAVVAIYLYIIGLTGAALAAELLPEVHAKPIVVAALASALTILVVELDRIRQEG